LVELLNLSSSLSGGYATQGELDQSASVLQANIDTKTNTSSFNDYTQSNDAKVNTLISFTGSYATTGSNTFIGNEIISGSLLVSGSGQNDLTVVGQVFISSSATAAATQPRLTVSGSAGQSIINRNSISTRNTTNIAQLNPAAIFANSISTSDEIGFTVSTTTTPNWATGPSIYVNDSGDTYPAVFGFQNKANYTDGRVTILTPLSASAGIIDARISGSALISGSLTITGSVFGNVSASSITAQTASIDLSVANYFTLTLSGATNINVLNPRPGVTATLVVACGSSGSATFSSNVKQVSGSAYQASPSGSTDIISLTAVDTSSIYIVPAYTFV
jgi:hypothetical protein